MKAREIRGSVWEDKYGEKLTVSYKNRLYSVKSSWFEIVSPRASEVKKELIEKGFFLNSKITNNTSDNFKGVRKYNLVMKTVDTFHDEVKGFEKVNSTHIPAKVMREVFDLHEQAEEVLVMLALDTKKQIIGAFEVSRGTIDSSFVEPREVFKRALIANAHSIIIGHNHPSGDTAPSSQDVGVTQRLKKVGDLLNVELLDHIIVGGDSYYSFLEEGMI